ncbi:MAG TPA: glycosyltransferase family 39 protein [Ktedonobacterales bacterium]|nr:glycosyltransferase family 39 protein [Ktedonobacterales bacterium]
MALGSIVVALVLSLQTLNGASKDYDEGVYLQSLRALAEGHPLFSSVFSSQPPLFLLSIYPFYALFGQSLSAARLGLLFFSLAGLMGMFVAGRALQHRVVGGVACLLLAFDPMYEHSVHVVQAELPSIAFQIWAVACTALAIRAQGRRRSWLLVGAGALLGCALMVKLFALVAVIPMIAILATPLARRWLGDDGTIRRPSRAIVEGDLRHLLQFLLLVAGGVAGAMIVILLPLAGHLERVYDQAVRFHLAAAQTNSHSLGSNLDIIWRALLASPLLYTGAVAIALLVWQREWMSLPVVLWACAAIVTLAQQQPLFAHHAVLVSPALALVAGYGACVAWTAFASSDRQTVALTVSRIVLVVACAFGLFINWRNNAAANAPLPARSIEMAIALQGISAPTEVVLSDDQYVATLANRDVPPEMVDTSAVRITSGYLTTAQMEDFITRTRIHVILFSSGRFDLLPGFRAWVVAHYTQVATFDHRGALYLLEPTNNPPV